MDSVSIGKVNDEQKALELDALDLFLTTFEDDFHGKDSVLEDNLLDLVGQEDPLDISAEIADELDLEDYVQAPSTAGSRAPSSGSDLVNARLQKSHARIRQLIFWCGKGFCCLVSTLIVVGMFFPAPRIHAVPASLAGSMDLSVDPCEDFYQYACGGWIHNNPVANDTLLNQFIQVRDRIATQMSKIIEDLHNDLSKASKWTKKLVAVHDTCMQEKRASEIPPAAASESLAKRVAEYHNNGIYPYFRFHIQRNPQDNTITLRWRTSVEADVFRESRTTEWHRQHIENLLSLTNDPNASATANAVIEVKKQLAEGLPENDSLWSPVSWEQFSELAPNFNWNAYWLAYGVEDFETKFKVVSYDSLAALQSVDALFNTTDEKLQQYERAEQLIGVARTTDELHDENERYTMLVSGVSTPPLWKQCVSYAAENFGWVLSQQYLQWFPSEKKDTTQLLDAVMLTFVMPSWMDEETKSRANEKKLRIVINTATPDWMQGEQEFNEKMEQFYGDQDLGDTMWTVAQAKARSSKAYMLSAVGKTRDRMWEIDSIQPTDVTAFYCPFENSMNFPAGVLRFPFIVSDQYHPNVMNWGSLGFLVGRELFRAFDEQGGKYDKDGQRSPWWDAETSNKYFLKQTCFESQYDALGVDGIKTRRENVADNAGFSVAYDTFLKNTENWEGVTNGRHLSEKQLFFIANAQMWCDHQQTAGEGLNTTRNDVSGEVRVRGIIQNAKDFGTLFKCAAGSPMNPVNKCSIQ